jgi:hypothetical protein
MKGRNTMGIPRGEYNGHRSWAAWNINLWIYNDEALYNHAVDCVRRRRSIEAAVTAFMNGVGTRTPDGAKYSRLSVRETLLELRRELGR